MEGADESTELRVTVDACFETSVTRLGDLLDFGQIFKAFGKN